MTQANADAKRDEPLAGWRRIRDSSLAFWSQSAVQLVNTEAYARTTGLWLDTYLNASIPLLRMTQTLMTQWLSDLNMPTRQDVVSVAERLTQIEMKLDDLDARLDSIERNRSTGEV